MFLSVSMDMQLYTAKRSSSSHVLTLGARHWVRAGAVPKLPPMVGRLSVLIPRQTHEEYLGKNKEQEHVEASGIMSNRSGLGRKERWVRGLHGRTAACRTARLTWTGLGRW